MFRLVIIHFLLEFGFLVLMHSSVCQKMVIDQSFEKRFSTKNSFKGFCIPVDSDVHALSTMESIDYATNHGIYVIDKETVSTKFTIHEFH